MPESSEPMVWLICWVKVVLLISWLVLEPAIEPHWYRTAGLLLLAVLVGLSALGLGPTNAQGGALVDASIWRDLTPLSNDVYGFMLPSGRMLLAIPLFISSLTTSAASPCGPARSAPSRPITRASRGVAFSTEITRSPSAAAH